MIETNIVSEKIPFTTLLSGTHSNFTEGAEITITSQKSLAEVFNVINSTRKPGYPIPTIEFDTETVFFYALKELSYGGAPIKIAAVKKDSNKILVVPVVDEIDPTQPVTMVLSSPFVMISIKKQQLPIIFYLEKVE